MYTNNNNNIFYISPRSGATVLVFFFFIREVQSGPAFGTGKFLRVAFVHSLANHYHANLGTLSLGRTVS